MIPKLHPKGTSFRGAAAYLLHDKGGAKTADRVEWTATRNLATERPEAAWRVMAATAMDGERRKSIAGIKATGRKSKDSVLHLTLSWSPDEAQTLTSDEMKRAADGALKALGADGRQVLIVCHNDEPQPHVHLLINRVSAEDGRMLPSSKEKLALSKWAQQYEQSRGSVLCHERVKNNERRDRGEYVRGEPEESRHIFEMKAQLAEKGRAKDVDLRQKEAADQERAKDAQLAAAEREMRDRHAAEWRALKERHEKEKQTLRHKVKELFPVYKLHIEKKFIGARERFDDRQRQAFREFAKGEKSVLGRMSNRLRSIDFPALLKNDDGQRQALRDAFTCLVSSSARMDVFKLQQRRERREFETEHKREGSLGRMRIFVGWRVRRTRLFSSFGQQRFDLFKQQEKERQAVTGWWKERNAKREQALGEAARTSTPVPRKNISRQAKRDAFLARRSGGREQDQDTGRERQRPGGR